MWDECSGADPVVPDYDPYRVGRVGHSVALLFAPPGNAKSTRGAGALRGRTHVPHICHHGHDLAAVDYSVSESSSLEWCCVFEANCGLPATVVSSELLRSSRAGAQVLLRLWIEHPIASSRAALQDAQAFPLHCIERLDVRIGRCHCPIRRRPR